MRHFQFYGCCEMFLKNLITRIESGLNQEEKKRQFDTVLQNRTAVMKA